MAQTRRMGKTERKSVPTEAPRFSYPTVMGQTASPCRRFAHSSFRRHATPPFPSALNILFPPVVTLFPRPSRIISSCIIGSIYYGRMANQYLGGPAHREPVNRRQASDRIKQPNWLHSIVAGAAMLAVSSLGVVLVFDWYFFSVVESLSIRLRPIAGAFHHANVGTLKNTENAPERPERTATIEHLREYFAVPSGERSNQARSLIVPVGSVANSKTPGN
ncbi:MAG: hypothetical protein QOH31_3291 [Verrucomicrobiota bacterium]|jgi:hypothetical protein